MNTPPKIHTLNKLIEYISLRNAGNIKYDLDRIKLILTRMSNPEKKLKGIHVAGTNGKGSTSAMLEAVCLSHDLYTGLNTSPHLVDYRERFRINGKNILTRDLLQIYNQWSQLFEETEASFFEITTAIAFFYFHQLQLHTSIFEVGLGGRLDATNPFKATISVITSISRDHPKTLGESLEQIAREKAGIIKKSVPVVIGKLPATASRVIKEVAQTNNAPTYCFQEDFVVENIRMDNHKTTFDLLIQRNELSLPNELKDLQTNLLGDHQAHNAALAIISFLLYCQKIKLTPDPAKIREGLLKVNWFGRMQIISNNPLTILDCAHNEEGIENLVKNLRKLFPGKTFLFVVAILRDKNFDEMITHLGTIAKKLYISQNHSERAADTLEQVKIAQKHGIDNSSEPDINTALDKAVKDAGEDDIVIVTGSIYTVSEILARKPLK